MLQEFVIRLVVTEDIHKAEVLNCRFM